ncbi:MAG TPA: DnaT-like ssDNA-binding protein [Caulobacter sp.]|nr:DnaT-like ssDNA-binding protein [Caulobacter sp.]
MAGYGDDATFDAWLASNGYSLPPGAPATAVLRQRGSTYLDGLYGSRYTGAPTGGYAQERAWPRTGATAYSMAIPDNVIPTPIIHASYAAALQEAKTPGSLAPVVTAGRQIKREKVEGAVEREYFQGGDDATANAVPVLAEVAGLVAPYLLPEDNGGVGLWAVGQPAGL